MTQKVTMDAELLRFRLRDIKTSINNKNKEERYEFRSELAFVTGLHIVLVLAYLLELYEYDQRIQDNLESAMKFYGIDEVLNKKLLPLTAPKGHEILD